jgi:hypothetical protein
MSDPRDASRNVRDIDFNSRYQCRLGYYEISVDRIAFNLFTPSLI